MNNGLERHICNTSAGSAFRMAEFSVRKIYKKFGQMRGETKPSVSGPISIDGV
jgi:hypothetical protein